MRYISSWIFILTCLGSVFSICVLDTKKGWRLDCGLRDSYLFRIKDIGGLKANFDFGLGIGDEKGFSKSISNTNKGKGHHDPHSEGQIHYGYPAPPAPTGYYAPPVPHQQPYSSYSSSEHYSAPEYQEVPTSYASPEYSQVEYGAAPSYHLPDSSYQAIEYRSDINAAIPQSHVNRQSTQRYDSSESSHGSQSAQSHYSPPPLQNSRVLVKKSSFPYKFEVPHRIRPWNKKRKVKNQQEQKGATKRSDFAPFPSGFPPQSLPPFLPPNPFVSGTSQPFSLGPPQAPFVQGASPPFFSPHSPIPSSPFPQSPFSATSQQVQFVPHPQPLPFAPPNQNFHGHPHNPVQHNQFQRQPSSNERFTKDEQFVFRENIVAKKQPVTVGPKMAAVLKIPANTQADTDNVPSFAAKMFVVRNAPTEFYPPKYKTKRGLKKNLSVQIPRTKFYCEEQKYLPGIYADSQLGCKMFHLCVPSKVGSTLTSYLCPNGTLFDQSILQCNYWYNVDCEASMKHYDANLALAKSYRKINAAHLDLFSATDNTALSLLSQNVDSVASSQVASSRMGRFLKDDPVIMKSPLRDGVIRVLKLIRDVDNNYHKVEFTPSEPIIDGEVDAIVVKT